MPDCNTCGAHFEWGFDRSTGRWIPIEPIETHDDLERTFQDENGMLRAEHRARHGESSVNIARLTKKVSPLEAQALEAQQKRAETNRRRRETRQRNREETG